MTPERKRIIEGLKTLSARYKDLDPFRSAALREAAQVIEYGNRPPPGASIDWNGPIGPRWKTFDELLLEES